MTPMARKAATPDQTMQAWIDARKRHHLTHAQIQMARELGMNPAKLGKRDNHDQEPWKLQLPQFIEQMYFKRFGKAVPGTVITIEARVRRDFEKKEARRAARRQRPSPERMPAPRGAAASVQGGDAAPVDREGAGARQDPTTTIGN
jgi:hypothetical protein